MGEAEDGLELSTLRQDDLGDQVVAAVRAEHVGPHQAPHRMVDWEAVPGDRLEHRPPGEVQPVEVADHRRVRRQRAHRQPHGVVPAGRARLLDTEGGLDVHRGQVARPGLELEVHRRAQLDQPGMALEPHQGAQVPAERPVTGGLEVAGVRAGQRHRRQVGARCPIGRGEAPLMGRGVRPRQHSIRVRRDRRHALLHRGKPLHQLVLEPREHPLRGVGLVGGDVVGHHHPGDRDVRVPGDERDESHGAGVGGARRDHLRLLPVELEDGEAVPEGTPQAPQKPTHRVAT